MDYAASQAKAVKKWKAARPDLADTVTETLLAPLGLVAGPVSKLVLGLLPGRMVTAAALSVDNLARIITEKEQVMKLAGVTSVEELYGCELRKSDRLADKIHRASVRVSAVEGAVTGLFGLGGVAVDMIALTVYSMATVHSIGFCYGYELKGRHGREFVYETLSASAAASRKERTKSMRAALASLNQYENFRRDGIGGQNIEQALSRQTAVGGAYAMTNASMKAIAGKIVRKKGMVIVPGVGLLLGAAFNGWYVNSVGWMARRLFQEKWLSEKGFEC